MTKQDLTYPFYASGNLLRQSRHKVPLSPLHLPCRPHCGRPNIIRLKMVRYVPIKSRHDFAFTISPYPAHTLPQAQQHFEDLSWHRPWNYISTHDDHIHSFTVNLAQDVFQRWQIPMNIIHSFNLHSLLTFIVTHDASQKA